MLLLYIQSMFPWFGWGIPYTYVAIVTILLFFLFFKSSGIFDLKKNGVGTYVLLFITCLWLNSYSISSLLYGVLLFFVILGLFSLNDSIKADIIRYITKWFAILSLVSLVSFLLFRLGISLPHSLIHYQDNQGFDGYGYIDNYYTFIYLVRSNGLRFQSVFLEPGHYTMGLAPLLFLNKYNWKDRYVFILLIAQLFTFSLAGYIVLFVGYLFVSFQQGKFLKTLGVVIIGAVLLFTFVYSLNYFYEDGIMEELILNRLIEENGEMASFKRTGAEFTIIFNRFLESSDVLFGVSEFRGIEGEGSSGFKPFLYVHGIVGVLLCVYLYLYPLRKVKTIITFGLAAILLLLLYQNAYPFWWCMLICLSCGSSYMINEQKE